MVILRGEGDSKGDGGRLASEFTSQTEGSLMLMYLLKGQLVWRWWMSWSYWMWMEPGGDVHYNDWI